MKKNLSSQGYTLIELVIVMLVLLMVGGMIVTIIYFSIRGITKAKVNNDVSQNGNYALSVISDFIASSKRFKHVTDSEGTIFTDCVTPINASSITITGFDEKETVFACEDGDSISTISSNSASLINTNQVTIVPGTCTMICQQQSLFSAPRLDISFELQAKQAAGTENSGTLFHTSINVRNSGL